MRRLLVLVASLPRRAVLGLLWVYQHVVSPWRPPTCRFYPSCSQYAVVAVRRHGALRGSWLAVRRLARCHPWAAGGVDDVPDVRPRRAKNTSARSSEPIGRGDQRGEAHRRSRLTEHEPTRATKPVDGTSRGGHSLVSRADPPTPLQIRSAVR